MNLPRVRSVQPKDGHFLVVEFDNDARKLYDVNPLLDREPFNLLRNPAFFKAVKVDKGGFAVYWSENIDISEYELWSKGKPI